MMYSILLYKSGHPCIPSASTAFFQLDTQTDWISVHQHPDRACFTLTRERGPKPTGKIVWNQTTFLFVAGPKEDKWEI